MAAWIVSSGGEGKEGVSEGHVQLATRPEFAAFWV